MNIRPEHLAAIEGLGYDSHESQFIYLVATHSGYFTVQQFLDFTQQPKGRPVHRFTQKLIQRRHARVTECARKTHVLNLFSRRVYGPIDKDAWLYGLQREGPLPAPSRYLVRKLP